MLLMRAFSLVVVLLLISLFSIAVYSLSFSNSASPLDRFPIVTRLETYYMTIASWEGVGDIFRNDLPSEELRVWMNTILIGADGKIVAYQGDTKDDRVGQLYTIQSGDTLIPLTVQGKEVGLLNSDFLNFAYAWRHCLFSFGSGCLHFHFFGYSYSNHWIVADAPCCESAGRGHSCSTQVASGDLSTRVPVSGPDDLRVLSDSFNHMAETLDLNDRERRDLLADIAHELRTPLTVIRGKLEGIVDGVYPPDETQIGPALNEAYLLERLVDDLRLLTLAETRQLHFEPGDVSFEQLASHAVDLFSAEAAEKKISLHLENRAQRIQVHVDPQRTEQVIGNLISNALRYVPESGKIWIIVEQNDNSVCLQVNDNGPGVPSEDLPHLFQRFWRGEKSRSRASGGAGLGLAIASQLIEAQGGSIKATNLPEGGLQVSITFPMVIQITNEQ